MIDGKGRKARSLFASISGAGGNKTSVWDWERGALPASPDKSIHRLVRETSTCSVDEAVK